MPSQLAGPKSTARARRVGQDWGVDSPLREPRTVLKEAPRAGSPPSTPGDRPASAPSGGEPLAAYQTAAAASFRVADFVASAVVLVALSPVVVTAWTAVALHRWRRRLRAARRRLARRGRCADAFDGFERAGGPINEGRFVPPSVGAL
ncbi:MAG: hypothetical protein AAGB00_09900 [Planctomycetota bacterium]